MMKKFNMPGANMRSAGPSPAVAKEFSSNSDKKRKMFSNALKNKTKKPVENSGMRKLLMDL